jgi:GTP-binding protein
VGKSTLFNRICGGTVAIVDPRPGSTRDRHFGRSEWNGRGFWLVDTGGMLPSSDAPMDKKIRYQAELAVDAADVVIFLVDVESGPTPGDSEIVEYVRRSGKPIVLVVNKADNLAYEKRHVEFYELGIGDPLPISAGTGKGIGDLLDKVIDALPAAPPPPSDDVISIAVIGRPNVGKSSLVNKLLGEDRLIVSDVPGTTRDAIDSPMKFKGRELVFIDTAGLRKKGKMDEAVEFYASLRTQRAIERADVCVILVDAAGGLQAMDLTIANEAWDSGTALIVAVNKWDLLEKDHKTAEEGYKAAIERAPFLEDVPFIYLSAKTGLRVTKVLDEVVEAADARKHRVKTAEVNRAIEELVIKLQPPQAAGGGEVKLLYGSQIGTEPPTFAIVSSRPDRIPESYRRFLVRGFRERFGFKGSPIRLRFTGRRRERSGT